MPVRKTIRYQPKPKSEREFQSQVIQLAKLMNWRIYHTYDSRRCVPGFPDLILIKDIRLIGAELKREDGKATPEQLEWLQAFAAVREVHSDLWRPSDFDRVQRILTQ